MLNGNFDNQELADIIHASPSIPAAAKMRVPVGEKGDRLTGKVFTADSSKIARILGLDLNAEGESFNETVVALVLQLLNLEATTKL